MTGMQIYALPTVWPDVSLMRRVVGCDFDHVRKYDVPSMWGNVRPRWRLLQPHLETKGPGGVLGGRERSGSSPTDLISLRMNEGRTSDR